MRFNQLENGKIRRTGKYLENPFHIAGDQGSPEEIEGEEDAILNPEFLGAPFAISHNKGSVRNNQMLKFQTTMIILMSYMCII
jgi:hypothetical protein